MILLWSLCRATVEWAGTSAAERDYMHSCQLNFWFNQCYNPFAHECQILHSEVLSWESWTELLELQGTGGNHCRHFVSSTLHRHWAYAFDPRLAIFHRRRLMAVFYKPERIPVLLHGGFSTEDCIRRSQRKAFNVIRSQTRTRWLAAVRVILLLGLGEFGDSGDVVDKHIITQLRDWDVAQCAFGRGSAALKIPDRLGDASMYLMEESVERALHGALVTYPEGGAGSKRGRLDDDGPFSILE